MTNCDLPLFSVHLEWREQANYGVRKQASVFRPGKGALARDDLSLIEVDIIYQ